MTLGKQVPVGEIRVGTVFYHSFQKRVGVVIGESTGAYVRVAFSVQDIGGGLSTVTQCASIYNLCKV